MEGKVRIRDGCKCAAFNQPVVNRSTCDFTIILVPTRLMPPWQCLFLNGWKTNFWWLTCYCITALPCYLFGGGGGGTWLLPCCSKGTLLCVWYIQFSSCYVLFTCLQSVFCSSWNKIIKGSGRPVSSHTSVSISELPLKALCVCHRVKFLHYCYSKYGKVIA